MLLAPGGGEAATDELFALIGVTPGKELDEAFCEGDETGCDCIPDCTPPKTEAIDLATSAL